VKAAAQKGEAHKPYEFGVKVSVAKTVSEFKWTNTRGHTDWSCRKSHLQRRLRTKLLTELRVDGKDPVSFFSSILRNESAPLDLRFAAAKELAPYAHPKLAAVGARIGVKSHEDRLEELQAMLDSAPKLTGGQR
jgi:hypothetical protein